MCALPRERKRVQYLWMRRSRMATAWSAVMGSSRTIVARRTAALVDAGHAAFASLRKMRTFSSLPVTPVEHAITFTHKHALERTTGACPHKMPQEQILANFGKRMQTSRSILASTHARTRPHRKIQYTLDACTRKRKHTHTDQLRRTPPAPRGPRHPGVW